MNESKFQTIVDVPDYKWKTGYSKQNLFMGSCFTENIGNKLETLKYNVDINPFGILYNPISIANGLEILLHKQEFTTNDLIKNNGLWHSFYHHSRFSDLDAEQALKKINNRINQSALFLQNAHFLFITFGTAWVYENITDGKIVSNCHKLPAKNFKRFRLSIQQIVNTYQTILNKIRTINPAIKVVFTVSPIRHWKDGAIENQRSKSTLLLAIDQIIQNNNSDTNFYFPSYEIVMDELRDYRFYAEDMLHISNAATQHIWEIFSQKLIDTESNKNAAEVFKIIKATQHKPFNRNSKEHFIFLKKMLEKTTGIESKFANLNLKLEKEYFINEMNKIEGLLNKNR